jgi:hypothetical protein
MIMKKSIKFVLLCFLLSSGSFLPAIAQTTEGQTRFSLEIDPATFAFGGYSLHLRIQPKSSDHFLVGAGLYGMNMPDFLVALNPSNKDQGWNVRIDRGFGLFAEYHFNKVNQKWFGGLQISLQEHSLDLEDLEDSNQFTNTLAMAYGGYTFQPFRFNLYFKPWAGIGYQQLVAGENILSGKEYVIAPVTFFATLHLGYTF